MEPNKITQRTKFADNTRNIFFLKRLITFMKNSVKRTAWTEVRKINR